MTKIPLSVFMMSSTKGHFGFDTYLTTLDHFARQIPWEAISVKVAHIKVTPGEEAKGEQMKAEFERRGFKVLMTVAAWQRGTSHQVSYCADLVTVSKEPSLYLNPHVLWLEDDGTLSTVSVPLDQILARMVAFLDASPELVSVRFIREPDFAGGVPVFAPTSETFFSPNVDFQPLLIRSRDFFLAAKVVESNPEVQQTTQIELLWRLILDQFSRNEHKHLVWLPSVAHSIHLGVPDYPALKQSLNL